MLIRLIGSVRIIEGRREITLNAPKMAAVLAALAARPGGPVSQHELMERVWGADPPESALSVLYSYIARLRSMLKTVGGARIDRASRSGYVLDVHSGEIDVHRVRELVAEAMRLAESGRQPDALDRLRAACELLDAPTLAGVPGRWAEAFRRGFDRERLGVHAERHRMELALGNHAEIVDELSRVVEAEPMAETLVGLLMLACYRCGRAADALTEYEKLRVRLRDELGADPSIPLQALHRKILNQDPALDVRTAAMVRRPAQLPAATAAFTGRDVELAELTTLADTGRAAQLVTIVGIGGVGKTALAVHWGHENRERFVDGQIYLNLRGFDHGEPVSPHHALVRLLSALGHAGADIPDDTEAAAELYRSATADLDLLVVLDNARDTEQVRRLLPGSGGFTIVTSRDRLTGLVARHDARTIRLDVLPRNQSVALLERVLDDPDPAAGVQLAELCGYLPLALRIAAARVAEDPGGITRYVESLRNDDRLSLLALDGDPDSAVAGNLALSYRALPAEAQAVFLRIGSLPGEDVSADLVNHMSGLPGPETERAVAQLLTGHLLEEHRPGRYRMHDLVRLFAAERAVAQLPDAERDDLIDRFIEWHHDRAYQDTEDEEANIFAAAEALSTHPRLWRLVTPLRNGIHRGRYVERSRALVEIALETATAVGDEAGRFRMVSLQAGVARMNGDHDEALSLATRAAELSKRLGDWEQVNATSNLGIFRRGAGDMRRSAEDLTAAMRLAQDTGQTNLQTLIAHSLIHALVSVGDTRSARRFFDVVAASDEPRVADLERARLRLYEIEILLAQGEFSAALETADTVVDFAQRTSSPDLFAWSLSCRARSLYLAGWPELALATLDTQLEAVRSQRNYGLVPEIMFHQSEVLNDLGSYPQAASIARRFRTQGMARGPYFQPQFDVVLAVAHNGMGEPDVAARYARSAERAFATMPFPSWRETALYALAAAQAQSGDDTAAARSAAEAEAISAPINNGRRDLMRRGFTPPSQARSNSTSPGGH